MSKRKDVTEMDARELCLLFPVIKNRLGVLGLFKSMHSFDTAERVLGYEVAEKLGQENPLKMVDNGAKHFPPASETLPDPDKLIYDPKEKDDE